MTARAERRALASSNLALEEKQSTGKQLKDAIASSEAKLASVKASLDAAALRLPCDSHPRAPVGAEDAARIAYMHGAPPVFNFKPRSHEELGASLGLFDNASGANIAGAGFTVLRGDGVLLELALIRWALDRVQVCFCVCACEARGTLA